MSFIFESWDYKCLDLARYVGQRFSKDPSTKVGAVVRGNQPNKIAWGINGLPPGIADDERLADREWKYGAIIHAEVNALNNAWFPASRLYSTHYPCVRCAADILSRRTVRRIITLAPEPAFASRWRASSEQARDLFEEAGLPVHLMTTEELDDYFASRS